MKSKKLKREEAEERAIHSVFENSKGFRTGSKTREQWDATKAKGFLTARSVTTPETMTEPYGDGEYELHIVD